MARHGTWTETGGGGGGWEPIVGAVAVLVIAAVGIRVMAAVTTAVAAVVVAIMWAVFAAIVMAIGTVFGYVWWRMRHPGQRLLTRQYQREVPAQLVHPITNVQRPAVHAGDSRPLHQLTDKELAALPASQELLRRIWDRR